MQVQIAVRLRKNIMGQWIVVHEDLDFRAWSGSRFVTIDEHGLPAGGVQVSNFYSREAAARYARSFGFVVRKEK